MKAIKKTFLTLRPGRRWVSHTGIYSCQFPTPSHSATSLGSFIPRRLLVRGGCRSFLEVHH